MNEYGLHAERDRDALRYLDEYYASVLHCQVSDLHSSGWTPIASRGENDPMTLLFGLRQVVYLFAPAHTDSRTAGPGGVASLATELHDPVGNLLNMAKPQEFFRLAWLMRLDRLVRDSVKRPLAPGCEPRLGVWYTTRSRFQPYMGPWVEWIERLDESTETDPFALALLARHGGGVFVVRYSGSIIAYIGLRAYSPHVWELTQPCLTASTHSRLIVRTNELFTALIARATRAAVEADRIPTCTISFRATALRRALATSGYLQYAHSSVYATTTP